MIGVVMHVRTKPEKSNHFTALVAQLQKDVRANEPDVPVFQVMRSQVDPAMFVFIEIFANEAARTAHADMPYHKAMSIAGWACVEGNPDIQLFTPLTDHDIQGVAQ